MTREQEIYKRLYEIDCIILQPGAKNLPWEMYHAYVREILTLTQELEDRELSIV
jgi:hypothetical protein